MSATLDAELFCSFFRQAPLLSVPGRTFPVANYYLEDLIEATGHIIEEGTRNARREYGNQDTTQLWVTTKGGEKQSQTVSLESEVELGLTDNYIGYSIATRKSMDRVDEAEINYDLIEDVLRLKFENNISSNTSLLPPEGANLATGAVLIFMPGIGEIRHLTERLQGSRVFGSSRYDIVPMHSALSSKDQRNAFRVPPKGCRKIIVATNICETSVTIVSGRLLLLLRHLLLIERLLTLMCFRNQTA
jgi:ATP-dependent RNA helicase DHX29